MGANSSYKVMCDIVERAKEGARFIHNDFTTCGTPDAKESCIAIRRADIEDISLIHNMADIVFRATYNEILTPQQIEYMMEWMYSLPSLRSQMTKEGHIYFIAENRETSSPCGYVSVQKEEPDNMREDEEPNLTICHLQKIYVMPGWQGYGVGVKLFNTIVEYVKNNYPSPQRIILNVNRHNRAVHFYEKMGMTKLREGDFPIGNGYFMNDYIMGLDL